MSYRKRAKGSWNCGKDHKKESNKSERQYEKEEVKQELEEHGQGENYRYRHKAKKKPRTRLQKVESNILWYEKRIRHWENVLSWRDFVDDYFSKYLNSLKSKLKKLEEEKKDLTE